MQPSQRLLGQAWGQGSGARSHTDFKLPRRFGLYPEDSGSKPGETVSDAAFIWFVKPGWEPLREATAVAQVNVDGGATGVGQWCWERGGI